ncbi:alpha/beta hydrolase [Streptomyces griseoincarnatus]
MRNSRIALFLAVGAVTPLVNALTPATASAAEPIDLDGTLLTDDDIRQGFRGMFFGTRDTAEAVAALKKAAAGGPQAADRAPRTPEPVAPSFGRTVPEDNGDTGFWAVVCADSRAWPRDPEQYRKDAIRDKAKYPLYGDFASHIKPCAFWKKTGSEPATRIANKVRALILQNEWDPQTPLNSGRGLRRAMKGSKMVTVAGGVGHGVHGTKSCADKTATTYLTTGRLSAKDVTCKAAPHAEERNNPDRLPLPTPPGVARMVSPF